jgi:protein CpxP
MRRNTWLSLAATVAAVATGAGAAFAAQGPGTDAPRAGMGMMDGGLGMAGIPHPGMIERMATELKLTADQQQKLRGVFESARPEMEQVRERARENAAKLRAAQPGSANYDAVVSEVARNAGELATRAVTNGAQLRAQVWAVLTPEQRTQLEARQAQRQAAMKERMEQRRARREARP